MKIKNMDPSRLNNAWRNFMTDMLDIMSDIEPEDVWPFIGTSAEILITHLVSYALNEDPESSMKFKDNTLKYATEIAKELVMHLEQKAKKEQEAELV